MAMDIIVRLVRVVVLALPQLRPVTIATTVVPLVIPVQRVGRQQQMAKIRIVTEKLTKYKVT